MSLESYQTAKRMILSSDDSDFVGGCTNELIDKAQSTLGMKLTGLYKDYLQTFGAGNIGSQEIYGIVHDDFENSSVPDSIWCTLNERFESNLPNHLLVIYDAGDDELYCLDFKQHNEEPKVVLFVPRVPLENQTYEVIADDFGDFLLKLVHLEMDIDK